MTWLKVGDEFPVECQGLSNGAFRTHVEGLSFAMQKETGGVISKQQVKRFAESPTYETDVEELVAHGFWTDEGDFYKVRHHMEWQVEPETLRRRRELNAERQRNHRMKRLGLDAGGMSTPPGPSEPMRALPAAPGVPDEADDPWSTVAAVPPPATRRF